LSPLTSQLLLQKYGNTIDATATLKILCYSNVLVILSVKGITSHTDLLFY